jgi:hypothetical protein
MKLRWYSVALGLLLLLSNGGYLWGAEQRTEAPELRSLNRIAPGPSEDRDQDLQESSSAKFKMLEWMIMQDLLAKYQKLEKNEFRPDTDD